MATESERRICTAPSGQFRVVHFDARDNWPTSQGDFLTLDEAKEFLANMLHTQRNEMEVFDDQSKRVEL